MSSGIAAAVDRWIASHQNGVPAGFQPILVTDVWEYAYLLDFEPSIRGNTFTANVYWELTSQRFEQASPSRRTDGL